VPYCPASRNLFRPESAVPNAFPGRVIQLTVKTNSQVTCALSGRKKPPPCPIPDLSSVKLRTQRLKISVSPVTALVDTPKIRHREKSLAALTSRSRACLYACLRQVPVVLGKVCGVANLG